MSPVIGVVLMVVITIALASIVAAVVLSFDDQLTSPDWDTGSDNPWAEDALFGPENPVAGATDVRYRVFFEVEDQLDSEKPLNHLLIEVDDVEGEMFNKTDIDDLETFVLRRNDGTEEDLSEGVEWKSSGTELEIQTTGSNEKIEEIGEVVEIIFGGVDNPDQEGIYDVTVSIKQGNLTEQEGDLEIVPA